MQLAKSISIVIGIFAIYFLLMSRRSATEIMDEYKLLTNQTNTASGYLTDAKQFDEEVESNDGRTVDIVTGFSYKYSFITSNGRTIEKNSGNYGDLPFNKQLSDVPFKIKFEYLPNEPNVNRIKHLSINVNSLFDWFSRRLLIPLIVFVILTTACFQYIQQL
ncbi:hypothetical protein LCGC14_1378750 [marine sediment metagenome]|uniref:DUF3592 domain-containing protein n=2 Tax=root TaxID=1 RepID=A0A831QTW2_9FLAO|nr:hypothetical protein [Pricia antarctica]